MTRVLNVKLLVWTFVVLVCAGGGLAFFHGYQARRNSGALLVRGDEARQRGDLNQALTFYTHYLAFAPDDLAVLEKAALTLEERAADSPERVHAVFAFEDLLRRDPHKHEIRYRLINHLIELRRFREAMQNLQILLPDWPTPGEVEHMLGWCQEATGDYAAALTSFSAAVAKDPGRVASYALLAEVLQERLNRSEQAEQVMNDMVAANTTSWRAHWTRSRFRQSRGDRTGADRDMDRALSLAPTEPTVLLAAAEGAQARGELSRAQALLGEGCKLHPENGDLVKAMASLELRSGRRASAIAILRAGLHASPNNVDLLVLLTDLLLSERHLTEAAANIAQIRRGVASSAVPDYLQGRLHVERLEWAQAVSLLERASAALTKNSPWAGRTHAVLGKCFDHQGKMDRALEQYQRAMNLGEREPRLVGRLVQLLLSWRRFVEAEQALLTFEDAALTPELARLGAEVALATQNFQRAIVLARQAIDPSRADYRQLLWLARVHGAAGENDQAEVLFRKAVAAAPHVLETWVALVEQLHRTGQDGAAEDTLRLLRDQLPARWLLATLARCSEAMGLLEHAEKTYLQALAQGAGDFALAYEAAEFFHRADWPAKAEPLWKSLLDPTLAAPRDLQMRARRQLALSIAASGRGAEAHELIAANEKLGDHVSDQRLRYVIQGGSSAARAFDNSLTRAPATLDELLMLAQLFDAADDGARARQLLLGVVSSQPENPRFLARYIRALIKAGERTEAGTYLARLKKIEPRSWRTVELSKMMD